MKHLPVARDGRDACKSLHNHLRNFTPDTLVLLDAISRNDLQFGDLYPRVPDAAGAFFHDWVTNDRVNGDNGDPAASFFGVENSFCAERRRSNQLLVHHNDLEVDRPGEMKRISSWKAVWRAGSNTAALSRAIHATFPIDAASHRLE